MKPEKLKSDGFDKDGNVIFNKYAYPSEYRDALDPDRTKSKDDDYPFPYKEDIRDGSRGGWHEIIVLDTNPNKGLKHNQFA